MKLSEKYLAKHLHPVTKTMRENEIKRYGFAIKMETLALFSNDKNIYTKALQDLDDLAKEENL